MKNSSSSHYGFGTTTNPMVSISIVSHGQGALIANLLDDLATLPWNNGSEFEVIVTSNIPEDVSYFVGNLPFRVQVVRNATPKGFGSNHNAAFDIALGQYFAVVNPDIRLAQFRLDDLVRALDRPDVGVCGPLVKSPGGSLEDSARRFPTVGRLLGRKLWRKRSPDYRPQDVPIPVDWLAGMFLLFRSSVYRATGGFNERYFMYLEDVELSRNLQRRGLCVLWVGTTSVVHDAARASGRNFRHMRWHIASLFRYLLAPAR